MPPEISPSQQIPAYQYQKLKNPYLLSQTHQYFPKSLLPVLANLSYHAYLQGNTPLYQLIFYLRHLKTTFNPPQPLHKYESDNP